MAGGILDFGAISSQISAVTGMPEGPIRLVNGRHSGSGGGYGVSHMLFNHAASLAKWDFYSVQDYVDHVAQGFDAVYRARSNRHIIVRRSEPKLVVDRLLVLELSKCKRFYSIVTGWPQSSKRNVNGELIAETVKTSEGLVWECRAPHSIGRGFTRSD
jgi:hypothetical protein